MGREKKVRRQGEWWYTSIFSNDKNVQEKRRQNRIMSQL